jgi:DNA-binding LacI/PurR family transcriptional regulator
VRSGRADGIVYIGRTTADVHLIAQMAADAPLVVWGPPLPEQSYCSVGINNRLWSQKAVAHLIALGRRRIAFLGEDESLIEGIHRYQGYEAAHQQAGLLVDPHLVTHLSVVDRAGKMAMQRLLAAAPDIDGVFTNSDVAAIAAMQVLRERGRSVPGDVAVVGFDNIAIGRYITPALTTVSPNLTDGVPVLVEKLLRLINGETEDPVTIPGRLVVRQSCGAAAGNGAS